MFVVQTKMNFYMCVCVLHISSDFYEQQDIGFTKTKNLHIPGLFEIKVQTKNDTAYIVFYDKIHYRCGLVYNEFVFASKKSVYLF